MPNSRLNRSGKRRRNKKLLSLLLMLAGILIVFFSGLIVFGSGYTSEDAEEKNDEEENHQIQQHDNSDGSTEQKADRQDEDSDENSDDKDNEDELEKEQLNTSKENVREAYTAEWNPVGTNQSGKHTINFDEGSQDREEMRTAVATATGLDEDKFTMWWIEGNGEQQVINTVSDPDETEIYRVYNKWVDGKGWKPTKVEELYKNDKK